MAWPKRKNCDADEIQHHGGHVHHVIGPIAPARQEPVKISEHFFGPKINTAFARISVCQLNHRNSLRPEKKNETENPKPDGHSSIRRNARYNVQVKYRHDEQSY